MAANLFNLLLITTDLNKFLAFANKEKFTFNSLAFPISQNYKRQVLNPIRFQSNPFRFHPLPRKGFFLPCTLLLRASMVRNCLNDGQTESVSRQMTHSSTTSETYYHDTHSTKRSLQAFKIDRKGYENKRRRTSSFFWRLRF